MPETDGRDAVRIALAFVVSSPTYQGALRHYEVAAAQGASEDELTTAWEEWETGQDDMVHTLRSTAAGLLGTRTRIAPWDLP